MKNTWKDIMELTDEAFREYEAARQGLFNFERVKSGYKELDRITTGFKKGDLIVIAARPGLGKTTFALNIARNIAIDFCKPVAYFSLKMNSVQLITRMLASEASLDAGKIKSGMLNEDEWKNLDTKIHQLKDAPIFIDDTPAISIYELRDKCINLKHEHKVQMIIVDNLHLIAMGISANEDIYDEINTKTSFLKFLAKELNIPLIVLSQLSRVVELRDEEAFRPIISDLRVHKHSSIELDADVVLFIYRPGYYSIERNKKGVLFKEGAAEIIVAKHRNGGEGVAKLHFDKEFLRFENLPSYTDYLNNNIDKGVKKNKIIHARVVINKDIKKIKTK